MTRLILPIVGALLLWLAASAEFSFADPIAVNNPSFELLPPGKLPLDNCGEGCKYDFGPIPDWVVTGTTGQFQPGPGVPGGTLSHFNSVPDGIIVGYTNAGSISQTVGATVQLGAIYTLQVEQGVRKDVPDPGQIEMVIGTNERIVGTGIPATPGNWSPYTAQYVGTAADVGKPISVVLSSPGPQGDWDKVSLNVVRGTPCAGECVNVFLPKPDPANQLTVVLAGDVRNQINIAATQNSPVVNPFAYVDEILFGGPNTSTVSTTLDKNGNTDLTFTAGLHPILNTYSFNYGSATNNMPHYGYEGINNAPFNVLSQTWSNQNVNTVLPTLSALCPPVNAPATQFALVFAEVGQGAGTEGQWTSCPVNGGAFSLLLDNPTATKEMLSRVGYVLTSTPTFLDLLNVSGTPPPAWLGAPSSHFRSLTEKS